MFSSSLILFSSCWIPRKTTFPASPEVRLEHMTNSGQWVGGEVIGATSEPKH